jgi:hypothetical protein
MAFVAAFAAGFVIANVSGMPAAGYTAGVVTFTAVLAVANFLRQRPQRPTVRCAIVPAVTLSGVTPSPTALRVTVSNGTGATLLPQRAPTLRGRSDSVRLRPAEELSGHESNPISAW